MTIADPNALSAAPDPSLRLAWTDVLDSVPDAVFIVTGSAGGQILYLNDPAARMFGYERSELLARSIDMLVPQSVSERHARHRFEYGKVAQRRPMGTTTTLLGRRRDGSEIPIDVLLSPSVHDDSSITIAIVRDVTEPRRLQEEVLRARDSAISANEVKSRFLAAASHDLRQPLQTIWNIHSMLARALQGSELTPHVELLGEAVRSMDQMLSALIDINRLEKGAIQPVIRDFSLQEILPRLRSEFSYAAASKSLDLQIDESTEFVRSDPMLLPVILRNLVGNAIKYTQRGAVVLSVRAAGEQLFIDVVDTGPGIPEEHLQLLFDAFYQIDNPNRDQRQGVGLGLSIVQTICRLLDHTVTIKSKMGGGSTFSVQLTRGVVADAPIARAQIESLLAPRREGNVTVLHIEDDPGIARSMAMLLSLEGYEVVGAATRDEALQHVNEHGVRPALVLCDFNLPMGFTGDEIVAEITLALGYKPPTIILTGDIAEQHVKKARRVAERILPKPVDINRLLKDMTELLGRGSSGEESHENIRDTAAERALESRSEAAFTALMTSSHLHILEDHPQSVFGIWPDFTLAYMNPAWFAFARRNGGDDIAGAWSVGRSTLDAVPECLRAWYVSLFCAAPPGEDPIPLQSEYECSSADVRRRFLVKVYPLAEKGFIVVNSLRYEVPHVQSDRSPMPPIEQAYTRDDGFMNQCAGCRRMQSGTDPLSWHWVPEWVRETQANARSALCPKCAAGYSPIPPPAVELTSSRLVYNCSE